jgi:gamma-butyrobetaine dioxygenase
MTDSVSFSTKEVPLHTDIPCYAPPSDYQFLYGLDVSGSCTTRGIGKTRFVDGFSAAQTLQREHPDMSEALWTIKVGYRAEYPGGRKNLREPQPDHHHCLGRIGPETGEQSVDGV